MKSRQRKEIVNFHKKMYSFYLEKLAPENVKWENSYHFRKYIKMRKRFFKSRLYKKIVWDQKLCEQLKKVSDDFAKELDMF